MILYSKMENGVLRYVENAEYKEFCAKNSSYKGLIYAIPHKTTQERTLDQNAALHKFFDIWAKDLNEHGLTVQAVFAKKMETNWNETLMKGFWKEAQERIIGKKSTSELNKTSDIDLILDHFTRHFANEFDGYELPEFPHDPKKIK